MIFNEHLLIHAFRHPDTGFHNKLYHRVCIVKEQDPGQADRYEQK